MVIPQPWPETRREVGQRARTKRRVRAACGTSSRRAALAGSVSASITGRRADARRQSCPTETRMSRSSSRGPSAAASADRIRARGPSARAAEDSPVGSAPPSTSSATPALRKSGWSVTPTGDDVRRETPLRRARNREGRQPRQVSRSPTRPDDVGVDGGPSSSVASRLRTATDSGPCARSRSDLAPQAGACGALGRWLPDERARLARRHVDGFRAAAADVAVVSGPRRDLFGERPGPGPCRRPAGSWSWARERSRWRPRAPARPGRGGRFRRTVALASNVSRRTVPDAAASSALGDVPDLPSDNALPRWLAEVAAGVTDLRPVALAVASMGRWTGPAGLGARPSTGARAALRSRRRRGATARRAPRRGPNVSGDDRLADVDVVAHAALTRNAVSARTAGPASTGSCWPR